MADNSVLQTIRNAEIDARSLSEFMYKPADYMVSRRLAPSIHALQYYIDYFESVPSIVNDAINNTAIEGGVLADTFVTATANGIGSIARSQRDKNSDVMSIADFESLAAAQAVAVSSNRKIYIPDGVHTTNTKPDITKFYGQGSILDTTTGRSYSAIQKGYLTLEMFGAVGDGIADDSEAIIDCANFAKGTNYKIQGESQIGYRITKQAFIYNDFDVSGIIFDTTDIDSEVGSYYLSIAPDKAMAEVTTEILGVTGLNEGSGKLTGLPVNFVGKYLHFVSNTAVLTERHNDGAVGIPYYKNTIVRVLDAAGNISPKLDMDINLVTEDIKVYVSEPIKRTTINIGSIGSYGIGSKSKGFISTSRNSVDFNLSSIKENAANFSTLVSVSGCDINVTGRGYSGAEVTGLGYNLLIGKSCDVSLIGVGSAKSRAGVDGRHASNLTLDNCVVDAGGTHWANNLVVKNSTVGLVKFAGRDLTLKDSRLMSHISVSAGIAYASGKLTVDNVTCDGENLFYGSRGTEWIFSTPRKMFDEVSISNITMAGTSNPGGGYLIFAIRGTQDTTGTYLLPKKITIKDIHFTDPNIATTIKPIEIGFNRYKDDPANPSHYDYRVENITHAGKLNTTTPYVYFNNRGQDPDLNSTNRINMVMRVKDCGKVVWYGDLNYFKSLVIENCIIASFRTISSTTQGGAENIVEFVNSIYRYDPRLNHANPLNVPAKLLLKMAHFDSAINITGNPANWRYFFNSTIEANVPNESIPADFKSACKKITIYSDYGEAIPYV